MLSARALAGDGLALLPAECALTTPESTQALLLQRTAGGEFAEQMNEGITWSSSDPAIATADGGVVIPVGEGTAVITARRGDETATMKVVVSGSKQPVAWGFRQHVEPILARPGCNSGACHGALAGKTD